MKRLILLFIVALLTASLAIAQPPQYSIQGTKNLAPSSPRLTAVDPLVYAPPSEVIPPRPFLYTVDKNGITITRFNDNTLVGTWPWPKPPEVIYTVLPNGSFTGLTPPAVWEPVAMTVTYPTETEIANRVKEIPDLTPPPTYVYVVMARSGYKWVSSGGSLRDTIAPMTDAATESAMLIQIDVSDPSFSASRDPANPVPPHVAGAILGHGAGQPVYDRSTGAVYVGNMPSNSLPAGLASFVSVIGRIPPEVAEVEAEVPGISIPVIRCGPQHPESGIPVGKPQAYACYDPSGVHPIDDNEHVGAAGNYTWEFRNLPPWLTAHRDKATGELDGILYGTPTTTGEWFAEARVHNLDDPYGVFSFWTPVHLLVTPTAEYLPIKAQFAAGVPVAYQLEGTGSCSLTGAPAWIDVQTVPNGCVVMGRAPLDGEYYHFTMPGFEVAGYPGLSLAFSGNVFGEYGFVPLPTNVGLSGLAWHQVSKVADPSTETPVLSLEYIGVEPFTGQLYRILAPPGKPQPPNERPPETALTLDVVSTEGAPLAQFLATARPDLATVLNANPALKIKFGELAVEADRDIYVAAGEIADPTGNNPTVIPIGGGSISDGALIKVSGGAPSVINLPGVQANSLSVDSDLRTAVIGVEPGQVDHNVLWVTGTTTGNAAVIDTVAKSVSQTLKVADAGPLGSVSIDFGTRYAYVVAESQQSVVFLGPVSSNRPAMVPRIWSAEEFTWNLGQAAEVQLMATGDGIPKLSLLGTMPPGLTFTDLGNGFATISGTPAAAGGGGGGELDVEGGDYAMTLTATSPTGEAYSQAFGITVQSPPKITSANTATFIAGAANSFTVTGTGWPTPIFYIWDAAALPAGVQLIDNENGTSSLIGTPETPGTYVFTINATTDSPPDAAQEFTLIVEPAGTATVPAITSANTFTWEAAGAPYSPDPFTVTSIGSPTPKLSVTGTLPPGVTFIDNGNSTGTLGAGCLIVWPGMSPECLGFLPDAAAGTYTFTINATNSAGTATQTFTLIVGHDATIINAAPATLSFGYTFGGTMPEPQTLTVTTGDVLPFAVTTTANWLTATPVSGTMPTSLTVSANPVGLPAGSYTGTVMVLSAGTEGPPGTVQVTLNVSALPMLSTTPGLLSFEYIVGGATPSAQTLKLTSGGVPLNYTVSTGGAKWLRATPASGTTPGDLSISVDPSQVSHGTYAGTITINAPGAGNGPQTMTVILVKAVTNHTLFTPAIDFMSRVGSSPEGLTVNRNTHDVFLSSATEAAGGGGEAGGEAGSESEVPGPPEPSAVFHVNPLDKTVLAEIPVHSEGEYIAVNSKTGRVYHASQGTGEVAVVDGATNTAVTFIAMMIGKDVYQPYQIAIDEAQNLIYVGAKAPPISDPFKGTGPFPCKAIHEMPDDEYDCWNPGRVFVIDGVTNQIVSSFLAGDDPEGVVFASATGKVYASNEDDGSVTVAMGASRTSDGSITEPKVLSTIIRGVPHKGWWQPECDMNNYCGERGQAALWPKLSACNGIDDEAEEADKMAVDPHGNVYIIDDRYRVAKIDGETDFVVNVLEIPGYQCEQEVPDGSGIEFRNTANNIAFMAPDRVLAKLNANEIAWRLFVTSEQNTVSLVDPISMTLKQVITIPDAVHLDAIATDPNLNRVYITDEELARLWILDGNGGTPGNAPILKTSAVSLDFGGIVMGGSSNPQILTISNTGNAPLNITSISYTGDFDSSDNCVTTLAANASCQLAVTFKPAGTGARPGVMSITSNAAGSPHQVTLLGSGTDFQVTPGEGGSSHIIQSGQSAVYNLNLTGISGFSGPVVLSCSGAPAGSTCNVNPSTVTISGTTAEPFSVTVTTTARHTGAAVSRIQLPPAAWLFCLALLFALCACMRLAGSARIRRVVWATASCGVLLVGIAGCGGHSNPPPVTGTPAGAYIVMVTATSNGATRTMPLTLVVK